MTKSKIITETRVTVNLLRNVHHLRVERKLTVEELAKNSGLSILTVRKMDNFEYDAMPNLRTLLKLSNALNVEITYLLSGV